MRTSALPLEGNKVKLTVEVDEEEIRLAEDEAIRRISREVRIPGFRPGKVPRKVIEARIGSKGIREEVLREGLSDYYATAVEEEALDVITEPEVDITSGEQEGPIVFSAVVEVRPEISIPGYEGLAITVTKPDVSDEEVDAQIDRLRANFATLTEVDRPAAKGDLVTLDIHGTRDGEPAEGLTADDLVYEVGTGGIVAGIDDKLTGASVGDAFEMDADDAPDGPAHLSITVKLVREKVLPEIDDAFASDASEFDTVAELLADLRGRIAEMKKAQSSTEVREKTLDALVELVTDDAPEVLVDQQTNSLVRDLVYRLAESRIGLPEYLSAIGQESDEFVAGLRVQATREVKADLALRAIAKAQDLEPEESDLDEEVVHLAGHSGQTPAQFRIALEQNGRMPELRTEIRKQKALTWLIDHVAIVDEEGKPVDRSSLRPDLASGHVHDHAIDRDEAPTPYSEES
ncbi:MAG TPA: trigger factor [Acidimicrobiales bacterium]|jgi:trigger factor|nr:trigger factor [Acidimicrobiales bacterium]